LALDAWPWFEEGAHNRLVKTLGILGGTGPESTIDYYRLLIEEHAKRRPEDGNPPLLIHSVNFAEIMPFAESRDWPALAVWLAKGFEPLKRAGADFGLIAANTPHIAFDLLEPISPLPLLSIVEATAAATKASGYRKVGLLGTQLTMEGSFYPSIFDREGIQLAIPKEEDREYVNRKYFDELFVGIFLEDTRRGLEEVIRNLVAAEGVEAVILGGTELPLILRNAHDVPVPLIDTARVHCQAALDRILA
jgi:aspartate racemase